MKYLFLTLLSLTTAVFANVNVDYKISHIHGLFDFVLAVSGEQNHAKGLVEVFNRSKYSQNEKIKRQLESFNAIKPSLYKSIRSSNSVNGRYLNININNQFIAQSIFSKNLKDFNERVVGLVPMSDLKVLFATLNQFEPIHDELIWKPSQKELLFHKQKLESLAKKINLVSMFKKTEKFYNSSWPQDTSFTIGLYAVPFIKDFHNGTTSHSTGSIEEHGVLIGGSKKEDLVGSFGVIFHELCHSLYGAQSLEVMKNLAQFFSQSKSKYKNQAYNWIDEAMATAIGNGWAFELANYGRLDPKEWYNDVTINQYGKALYPLIKKYIDSEKSIDNDFVDQAISLFEKTFPDSIYSYESILNKMSFVYNKSFLSKIEVYNILNKEFRVQSFDHNAPINDIESIKSIKESNGSVMFVFNENEYKLIEEISSQLPEIKNHLNEISKMKNKSIYSFINDETKAYIFIKVNSEAEFIEALKKMKFLKLIKNPPVIESF